MTAAAPPQELTEPTDPIVAQGFRAHPVGWLKSVWGRLDKSRSFGLAAEMAFWLFLSLLPLAAVAGLVTAKLDTAGNGSVLAPLLDSLPEATRDLLTSELGKVAAWKGGKVGITAGVMFVWLASSGVHSVFDGIELESDSKPRPWWKKRLLGIASCVGLSLGLAAITLLGTGLGWIQKLVGDTLPFVSLTVGTGTVGHIVRLGTAFLVSFGLIYALFRVAVPRRDRDETTSFAPGALVAVVLQAVVGFGYGFYIKQAGDGGAYQAGLASIGVTLTALYLFCLMLLIGTKVNEMIAEQRAAKGAGAAEPAPVSAEIRVS